MKGKFLNLSFEQCAIFACFLFFMACKKDKNYETTFSDVPEALAKYDNVPDSGLYRGVLIGSTGTIIIDLANFGNDFTATLIIDGDRIFFELESRNQSGVHFRASDGSTFTIGNNYEVTTANIVGHPGIKFIIEKEFSNARVRCYEGTYSGGDQGVINGIVYKENILSPTVSLSAIFKSNNNPQGTKFTADGIANANDIVVAGNASTGSTFTGKVKGSSQNIISGTWTNSNFNINGTFSCKRTL